MKTNVFKVLILVIAFLAIASHSQAQIQGSVKDPINRPVPFANVLLMHAADSSVVLGVMATEEGTYNISEFKSGNYIIGASLIGYSPAWSAPFVISSSNDHIHNEPILLEKVSRQIEDVDVVAKKPIYELKADRMVVNVENSITASGNTALQLLEKSPGVVVNDKTTVKMRKRNTASEEEQRRVTY